jgi:hypothetical protein
MDMLVIGNHLLLREEQPRGLFPERPGGEAYALD